MVKTPSQMLDILLASLIEVLRERDRLDGLCAKSIHPGNTVALDYGSESCGGMAWVQLTAARPSTSFPEPDVTVDNCTYSLAYDVTMGVIRPVPLPKQLRNSVEFPTDEQNSQAAYESLEDMDIMHQAIRRARKDIDLIQIRDYAAIGPEGGTAGGTWAIQVGNEDPD